MSALPSDKKLPGKKKWTAGKARYVLSLVVFFLFLLFFLYRAGGTGSPLLPGMQAVPAAFRWWAAAAVFAVSALFAGRVYCSFLCPLGTFQETAWRLGKQPRTGYLPGTPLRFGILALVLVSGALGISIVPALLDPYAAFGRGAVQLLRPAAAGGVTALSGFLEARGIYGALPHVSRVPFVPELFWSTAAFFLLLAVWSVRRGRPFCGDLCPVGTFLGLFSTSPLVSVRFSGDRCTGCGLCERNCPQNCISLKERHIDADRCVLCLRCIDACPGGGLSLAFAGKTERLARRGLLRSAAGGAAALAVMFWSRGKGSSATVSASFPDDRLPVSPPGSGSHGNFTKRCVACMACTAACPAGIIRPSLGEWGARGLFQPVLDYEKGYCQYSCNACGKACPTGAIIPLLLEEKQRTSIGKARFLRRNCIVRKYGTACGACSEHCPTQAMHMVPFRGSLTIPELDPSLCLGCGACESVCPAEPKAAIVSGIPVHGKIRETRDGGGGPVMAPLEEFPF